MSVKKSQRAQNLKNRYRITLEDYDRLIDAQGGVCAICGLPDERRLHIDHINIDGIPHVRGLLCGKCNRGLGNFNDSVETILSAVNYLHNRHKH